jgi:hypothetical protein
MEAIEAAAKEMLGKGGK